MPSILQASLVGGELAPALWGRTDLDRYLASLGLCRNFEVQPYGGLRNRAGTKFCAIVKNSGRARLIPFNFNMSQSDAMEFGAGYIRFHSLGAPVVLSATPAAYSATTIYAQGNTVLSGGVAYYSVQGGNLGNAATNTAWWYPLTSFVDQFGVTRYIVEIPTPYSATDVWALDFTQSLDVVTLVHPNYPPQQLGRYASDTWTLTPFPYVNGPFQAMNIDTTNTIYASATGGVVTLTSTKGAFLASHVGRLIQLQTCSFGYAWAPGVAVTAGAIWRSQGNYYQATNSGTTGTVIPSHVEGVMSDGSASTCILWQYLDSGWGIAQITAVTNANTATATVLSPLPVFTVGTLNAAVVISAVAAGPAGATEFTTGAANTFQSGQSLVFNIPWKDTNGASHIFAGGGIISVIDTTHFTLTTTYGLFATLFPLFSALTGAPTVQSVGTVSGGIVPGPTFSWALGAWGGTYGQPGGQGYPSSVEYFQQRLAFAGTPGQPQTVWMSRTGSYVDFGISNPIVDDDSITFTIANNKGNAIQELLTLAQLIILTDGAEFKVGQNPEDVITPSNISTTVQGFRGANSLPPMGIQNGGLFIQGNNRTVRGVTYDFASNSFTGNDIMILASHLTDGHSIVDWAYQQDPTSIIWCVREDGELLGLTYMPEQQVAGWHRHDTFNGKFESVCTVNENTGAAPYQNTPYFIINRTINGQVQRTIEYFAPRLITDVRNSFFVDCGMTFDGRTGFRGTPWDLTLATVTLSGGTNWNQTDASITVTSSIPFFVGATDIGDAIVFEDVADGILYKLVFTGSSGTPGAPGFTATGILNKPLPLAYRNAARSDFYIARNTFSGLPLAGQTIAALADGNVIPQQVVSGAGGFTLPNPAFVINAGLPITAQVQTLPVVIFNYIDTNRDKWKLVNSVRVMVNESRGLWAGPDFDHLLPMKSRSFENYDQPPNLITDLVPIYIQASWVKFGQVCLQTTDPLPLSILSIIPDVAMVGGT